jgi:hypothetical protein
MYQFVVKLLVSDNLTIYIVKHYKKSGCPKFFPVVLILNVASITRVHHLPRE